MAAIHYKLSPADDYALTGGPHVYDLFTPTSQSDLADRIVQNLLVAFHPAMSSYGWVYETAIAGGHRVRLVSPQFYNVFLDVFAFPGSFGRNPVILQFRSASGTGAVGNQHVLDYQPAQQYQILCNPADLFISRPGVAYAIAGSAFCGGIPRVDDGCGFGAPAITEVWWAMGDWLTGIASLFTYGQNPRTGLDHTGGGLVRNKEGCVNGSLVTAFDPDPSGKGSPQILRISSGAYDNDGAPGGISAHPRWADGVPILYPAFVGWGDPVSANLRIRGQVYDAVCRSKDYPWDTTEDWDGFTWMNYTRQDYFFGSLWVIQKPTGFVEDLIVNVHY